MTRVLIIALLAIVPSCDKGEAEKPAADNTRENRDDKRETPLDQAQNGADVDITAEIRRAVMDDASLSVNARNVKIITANGEVTLRGPVESADEKATIAKLAQGTAGVTRVDNQLEIAAE